jgi:hypothetical protein
MEKETNDALLPTYFDEKALIVQPQPIYRLKSNGNRYYYTFTNGEPTFFISVTTLIRSTLPTPFELIKWMAEKGMEESKAITEERAGYGTMLHICIGELLINRKFDLELLSEKILVFASSEKIAPETALAWMDDLKQDILSFAQFMIDNNVRPLAIEIMLTHPEDKYAGAIDLVCSMTISETGFWGDVYLSGDKKGKPKATKKEIDIMCIIDFKSGKKGFYESHEIQLEAYRQMWNCNYPQHPILRTFNWSPNNWRGATPTYKLKEQTTAPSRRKLPYLISLAQIEEQRRGNTVILTEGLINVDHGITPNIREVSLYELVKGREDAPEPPPNTEDIIFRPTLL